MPSDTSPRSAQIVGQLGQPIYGHQAPNGWPETGDQWMNTGAILNRINFGMLVAAGRLGDKTKSGFYKKDGKVISQFDVKTGEYVPAGNKADKDVTEILKKPAAERLKADMAQPERFACGKDAVVHVHRLLDGNEQFVAEFTHIGDAENACLNAGNLQFTHPPEGEGSI